MPDQSDHLKPGTYPDCPNCKGNAFIIPIFYGLRSPDAIQLAARGAAELGDYFHKSESPSWRCKACGLAFNPGE